MKKIISLLLVVLMAVTVFSFAACDNKATTEEPSTEESSSTASTTDLKFGLGVVSAYDKAKDADGEVNGSLKVITTAVAVLLDAEGKIADIALDTLDAKAEWTSAGVAAASTEMKTKYELGTDYGMSAIGKKEWNEQADAFVATAKGKTVAEVKAFMTEDTYTTGDLATAGCTISIGDIVKALDKAVANAVVSKATSADKLSLAFATSVKNADVTEEGADGKVEVTATIVAAVTDAEGKVVVAKTDAAQSKVTFDAAGVSTTDTTAELKTKAELGTDYGMSAIGKKEWNEQAAAFDSSLVGKTANDFAALADSADLATAGCTIDVADMIKAATAAATVA